MESSLLATLSGFLTTLSCRKIFQSGSFAGLMFVILAGQTGAAAASVVVNINARSTSPQVISLDAGIYDAMMVNPSTNSAATYTAWSFGGVGNYITRYFILPDGGSELDVNNGPSFSNAQDAFNAAPNKTFQFEVLAPEDVAFFVKDTTYSDNAGGISLLISEVVSIPVPATLPLLLVALGGLGVAARSERRPAAAVGPRPARFMRPPRRP